MHIDAGTRASASLRAPLAPRSRTSPLAPVEVWTPGRTKDSADRLARVSDGPSSRDRIVEQVYRTATDVLRYVRTEFGRDSFDGAGSTLRLRAHSIDPVYGTPNNAFWDKRERRIWIGDGDGVAFAPFGGAPDVVAHEFFHAVIDSEVQLRYVEQQGAIHESFADVLATGIDGNWQVAERVYTPGTPGDALRDLSKPTYRTLADLPAWESDTHALSEVPSYAAYQVGAALGMREMRRIWYTALTDHLADNSGFAGARDATVAAAEALYGRGSRQSQAVLDAWTAVGISSATPLNHRAD